MTEEGQRREEGRLPYPSFLQDRWQRNEKYGCSVDGECYFGSRYGNGELVFRYHDIVQLFRMAMRYAMSCDLLAESSRDLRDLRGCTVDVDVDL